MSQRQPPRSIASWREDLAGHSDEPAGAQHVLLHHHENACHHHQNDDKIRGGSFGTPANIPVLTTYIFQLTNWSPPLLQHGRRGCHHSDDGDRHSRGGATTRAEHPQLHHCVRQGLPAKKRSISAAGDGYPHPGARLPLRCRCAATLALIVAAFRRFLFIPNAASLVDLRHYSLIHFHDIFDNPLTIRSIWNTMEVGIITAVAGGALAFAIGYTVHGETRRLGEGST